MKLDPKAVRHLGPEDWRVLTGVEAGSKSHEVVPTPIIEKNSHLRGGRGGVHRAISNLARIGLIAKVKEQKYDGYRLTYGGLDYLALHAHTHKKAIYSVGSRIGVGKESDIVMVSDDKGTQKVLKIHRLGRISFRTVKTNRDYLNKNQRVAGSWMYLSRLAAMKEFAFMKVLLEEGFPVPEPIAHSRHTIVMTFIDSLPLRQINAVADPAGLYADLIGLILRLAKHGLIHGDFNEFNILIKEERDIILGDEGCEEGEQRHKVTPILIDFPQMVSMDHENAEMYFNRDVQCVKTFFERRFKFTGTEPGPFFKDAKKTMGAGGARRLDAAAAASGFTKKMLKDLETAIKEKQGNPELYRRDSDEDEDEDEEEEDEEGEENEGDVETADAEQDEGVVQWERHQEDVDPHPEKEADISRLAIT